MAPDQIRSQILSKLEPKEKHDPQFTTGHDLVSSKFMACKAMLKYLQDCHCLAIFEVSLTLNMSQMNCKEEIRSCVMNRMAAIINVLSQLQISASQVSGTVNPRKLGFSSPSLPPPFPPPPHTHSFSDDGVLSCFWSNKGNIDGRGGRGELELPPLKKCCTINGSWCF